MLTELESVPASQLVLSGEQKLSIDRARIAAGNTVVTAGPGPSNRVAHMNVERVRHKREALSHRDSKSPVRRRHLRTPPRVLGASVESELAAARRLVLHVRFDRQP